MKKKSEKERKRKKKKEKERKRKKRKEGEEEGYFSPVGKMAEEYDERAAWRKFLLDRISQDRKV